jgi:hypothetical protein
MPAHRTTARNVVLVHGGFVDGSGWQQVYQLLRQDGYNDSVHALIGGACAEVPLIRITYRAGAGSMTPWSEAGR